MTWWGMLTTTAYQVHDMVGHVDRQHVQHEAVAAAQLHVLEAPGLHTPHQDGSY